MNQRSARSSVDPHIGRYGCLKYPVIRTAYDLDGHNGVRRRPA
jgi:hypothetical protein